MFSQTPEQLGKIEQYKDFYKIENTELIFTKIIDSIPGTKDEIFTKVVSYFATAYKSANDVIQQQDKDAGIIIGKGIFDVYKKMSASYSCFHTIRIDIKDGRARVILSVDKYKYYNPAAAGMGVNNAETIIVDNYPIITENLTFTQKANKKLFTTVFIGLCETVESMFYSIEKALKTKTEITSPSDNW
jgi:hypothetical protein